MNRFVWHAIVVLLGLFLFPFVDNTSVRADDTVKMRTPPGWATARSTSGRTRDLQEYGVNVELVVMENPKERFPTLMAIIQMIASTVDTALLYLKRPTDFQYVVAIDDSNGGDGIVAIKDIKSIADLKGKKVAVNDGSVSEFYLNVLLGKAGG